MDRALIYIKYILATVGGLLTTLLGGWDMMLKVLVLFVVLDYFVGVMAAFMTKTLNSNIGFKGICKKILLFVPIVIAYYIDQAMGADILRNLAIWFYLANEGLSIMENLGKAGVLIPKPLIDALEQIKQKNDGEVKQDG